MTFRVAATVCLSALALAGCSLIAPSPSGSARVNGAPLSDNASDALARSAPSAIVIEAPGCDRARLEVDGGLTADGVVDALTAMGVIQASPGALTIRSGDVDLTAFGERLRCRDRAQATTSAEPGLGFGDDRGVDRFATSRFGGDDPENASRFSSFATPVEGSGPIDAARIRPGSGFFRAQLGVYPSYPDAVSAWRDLIADRGDVFRGEPVVVQPFAGSFRLNVLRRSLVAAETFCRDAKSAGALLCVTGPY